MMDNDLTERHEFCVNWTESRRMILGFINSQMPSQYPQVYPSRIQVLEQTILTSRSKAHLHIPKSI